MSERVWSKKDVWIGIGVTAVLHLLLIVFPLAFFFIGIVQFLYLIPAMIVVRKNKGIVQGILIASGITFLLNAACFGYVTVGLNGNLFGL